MSILYDVVLNCCLKTFKMQLSVCAKSICVDFALKLSMFQSMVSASQTPFFTSSVKTFIYLFISQ